jgi:hypothetical protein
MSDNYLPDYCRALSNTPDSDYMVGFIELPHIFDGWSVAVMRDGSWRNRWPPDDHRHKPTQEWIERMEASDGG